MGRDPIKESKTPYKRARLEAAEWNERLYSREQASEALGIAEYTLGDYERGAVKRVPPDMVLRMAELYNAQWLITNYCRNECPIKGFLPLATEEKNIQGIALRILKGLKNKELEQMKERLIDITEDGNISEDEVEALRGVSVYLESLAEVISEFKIVCDKFLRKTKDQR